tara:strand:+ start:380 stop:1159 length:780 start_codon:yes stop_codon:yes gene_type:complete
MNENEKVRIESTGDGKITVGGVLTDSQREALGSITPSADDILKNMEEYNQELEETYGSPEAVDPPKVPKTRVPKASGKRRKSKEINKEKRIKKENKMDLDKELENMEAKMNASKAAEKTETEEVEVPMDMKGQIMELLKGSPDAPTDQQIAQWKANFGQNAVHVMALGEGDVYIFTHLKRGQWKKIQEMMAKIQESGQGKDIEDELKEKVLQHCCLWPKLSVEFFYNSRAGVADSLYQVILLNSYFLSPQQAMLLTTQL